MPRLPPSPELSWSAEGVPVASAFDDGYFSKAGGLAESEAVFLAGTDLPERWRNRDRFAVCELGFGTGLNVLAAWKGWKTSRNPHAILHITSIEAFPLAVADAARALAHFPEVAELSEALLACWPVRAYAPQRLWFPDDGFALTLFTGEAETILRGMEAQFDAWFLDGFAPARNPGMWTDGVFAEIARLSAPGARAATFTVAGAVRRGLESAGFAVEKKPGFGAKRERLEAVLERGSSGPRPIYPYAAVNPQRVAVIGAGIAGAACAAALARRSVETVVLEAARTLGAGASGNPAALVMPRFDRGGGAGREFLLAAYLDAVATYETLGVFESRGVEQRVDEHDAALADLLADPPLLADWLSAMADGALHPRAGVVRPSAVVEAMLRDAQLQFEAEVRTLERADDGRWILRASDGRATLKADAVVLACGAALTRFEPASFLPIGLSHGQVEWGSGAPPPRAITRGSYVAPFESGVLFGATFDKVNDAGETPAVQASRARNLAALRRIAPEVAASVDETTLQSRAALRATTPDRLPIAGLLPNAPAWRAQYASLAHGAPLVSDAPPPAHHGVYVIGGLGARGFTFAPLLGERIAAEMCGEPPPLSRAALDAIHPARFLHRALKRR